MWLLCHTYLVIVTVSIAVGVAIRFPISDRQQAGRFRWLYLHPNTAGTFLAVSTVLLLGGLLRFRGAANTDSGWPTWWYGAGLAIHFAALLATASRGAIAGAVAGLIVVGWSATPSGADSISRSSECRPSVRCGSPRVATSSPSSSEVTRPRRSGP